MDLGFDKFQYKHWVAKHCGELYRTCFEIGKGPQSYWLPYGAVLFQIAALAKYILLQ